MTQKYIGKGSKRICIGIRNISELEIKYHDLGKGQTFVSASAWKQTANAIIGGVGMLLSPRALKSFINIKKIQH